MTRDPNRRVEMPCDCGYSLCSKRPRRMTARARRPITTYYPGDIVDGIVTIHDGPLYAPRHKKPPYHVSQRVMHEQGWVWVWAPQKRPAEYYVLQCRPKMHQQKVLALFASADLAHLARAQITSLIALAADGKLSKGDKKPEDVKRGARRMCASNGVRWSGGAHLP